MSCWKAWEEAARFVLEKIWEYFVNEGKAGMLMESEDMNEVGIELFGLRVLSQIFDLVLVLSFYIWVLAFFTNDELMFERPNVWVLSAVLAVYVSFEAIFRGSPGKLMARLSIEFEKPVQFPGLNLLGRSLLKVFYVGAPIVIAGWIIQVAAAIIPGLLIFAFPLLLLPVFYLQKTSRISENMIYDSLFSTHVELKRPAMSFMGYVSSYLAGLCVCLVILVVSMPLFLAHRNSYKPNQSSVKANMFTLQTIVETYGVDWAGEYSRTLSAMKQEGQMPGREYWKEFNNPFTGRSGEGLSYQHAARRPQAGVVTYEPVLQGGKVIRYYIYGYDKQGKQVQDKGRDFVLTNG